MERKVEFGILCEIYGKLLTKRQFNILNDYFNNDLSLSEIAENNDITRQAVNDIVKKGEAKLLEYESKLGILRRNLSNEKHIQNILSEVNQIKKSTSNEEVAKILSKVEKELKQI